MDVVGDTGAGRGVPCIFVVSLPGFVSLLQFLVWGVVSVVVYLR